MLVDGAFSFRQKVTSVKTYTLKDIKGGDGEGDFSTKRELTIADTFVRYFT
jgi:hypothetical protein